MLPFAANRERAGRVNGWLRSVRTSSGIRTRELAGRMGVQRGEITRLERLERDERLGMGKLRQAAGRWVMSWCMRWCRGGAL